MKAARIHNFGGPEVIVFEDVPRPMPATGEVLVRVAAAGVAPWDALIREGKSKVTPPPPLTLGSDLSGVVEETGPGVSQFIKGDEVYGATNPGFVGAQAEYAVASATMIARKPLRLSHLEAASAPAVAVTAWQMLHDYAHVQARQTVLILGAAGNVGAYAVHLAANAVSLWNLSHHSRASPRIAENCRLRNPSRTCFTGVHVEELKQDLASRLQSDA